MRPQFIWIVSCFALLFIFQSKAQVQTIPFTDDFEGAVLWTSISDSLSLSNWELGTPNYGSTNSAHSLQNAWDIDLNSGYTAGAKCNLYSPFFDFTDVVNPTLSFWHNYSTEVDDGVTLQYSIDSGITWQTLGTANDPYGENWFNDDTLLSGNGPGWSGTSAGWIKSSYDLINDPVFYNQPPLVQFKYVFTSGVLIPFTYGYSIDDFSIIAPPDSDVSIHSIVSPYQATIANNPFVITARLKNSGAAPVSNINIYYQSDANPVNGPFIWNGILYPGQFIDYSFPPIQSPQGYFNICVWADLPGDNNVSNDTSCAALIGVPVINLGQGNFFDDFENGNIGWLSVAVNPNTKWERGLPNWKDITASYSPVNAWMTNRSSGYNDEAECYLYSPFFDFNAPGADSAQLSFWQNIKDEPGWDGARLEYSDDGITWHILGTSQDPNGTNWYNDDILNSSMASAWSGNSNSQSFNIGQGYPGSININGWIQSKYKLNGDPFFSGSLNGPVRFRFVFTSDASVNAIMHAYSGHAIDDFQLKIPCPNDVSIDEIIDPGNGPAGSLGIIKIRINNEGLLPAQNIAVSYCITPISGAPICAFYSWPGTISPLSAGLVVLPSFTFPTGPFELCVYTLMPGDCDQSGDTLCKSLIGIPVYTPTSANPFSDNFDGINLGWTTENGPFHTSGNITKWELGTPNYGATTGAHSVPNAWDINLDTTYFANAETMLYSPYFNLQLSAPGSNAGLSFWQNFNTEPFFDGLTLGYRYNNSGNWHTLGFANDFNGTNWFNSVITTNVAAWSGNSNGWKYSSYNLMVLPGMQTASNVQFRFRFLADGVTYDGHSIDDFSITNTVGISETGKNNLHIYPNPVTDHLYISFPESNNSTVIIRLLTMSGTELLSHPVQSLSTIQFDVKSIDTGIYILEIFSGYKSYYARVVKN